MQRVAYAIASVGVVMILATPGGRLLSQPQAGIAVSKSFEVVSIKPVNRQIAQSSFWRESPNGDLSVHAVPLLAFITSAYNLQDFQIKGLPQWTRLEEYDLQATTGLPGANKTRTELQQDTQSRLRALLVDRCGLVAHLSSTEAFAYVISTPDGGRQLQLASQETFDLTVNPTRLRSKSISLTELATQLSALVNVPILDRSGLVGRYQLSLDWTSNEVAGPDPDLANLVRALRAAGLQLKRQK